MSSLKSGSHFHLCKNVAVVVDQYSKIQTYSEQETIGALHKKACEIFQLNSEQVRKLCILFTLDKLLLTNVSNYLLFPHALPGKHLGLLQPPKTWFDE